MEALGHEKVSSRNVNDPMALTCHEGHPAGGKIARALADIFSFLRHLTTLGQVFLYWPFHPCAGHFGVHIDLKRVW